MGPAWQLLLQRIGDGLMMHLLAATSLFAGMGAGNCLQLTGRAVTEVGGAGAAPRA